MTKIHSVSKWGKKSKGNRFFQVSFTLDAIHMTKHLNEGQYMLLQEGKYKLDK